MMRLTSDVFGLNDTSVDRLTVSPVPPSISLPVQAVGENLDGSVAGNCWATTVASGCTPRTTSSIAPPGASTRTYTVSRGPTAGRPIERPVSRPVIHTGAPPRWSKSNAANAGRPARSTPVRKKMPRLCASVSARLSRLANGTSGSRTHRSVLGVYVATAPSLTIATESLTACAATKWWPAGYDGGGSGLGLIGCHRSVKVLYQ